MVSPNSPLGQALMGKKEGDRVSYEAPSGPLEVEIVEVVGASLITDPDRVPLGARAGSATGFEEPSSR